MYIIIRIITLSVEYDARTAALIGSNVDKVDINSFCILYYYYYTIKSGAYYYYSTRDGDPLPVYLWINYDVCAHRPAFQWTASVRAHTYCFYCMLCIYIVMVLVMYERTNHGLSIIIIIIIILLTLLYITDYGYDQRALSDPSNDTSISKGPVVVIRPRGCELSGQNTLCGVYHTISN